MVQQEMLFGSILHVIFYIAMVVIQRDLFMKLTMNATVIIQEQERFLIIRTILQK